jgi:hypothetical protein
MEKFKQAVYRTTAQYLAGIMVGLEDEAGDTDVFGDDTGATRGSITGYAVAGDGSFDNSSRADDALSFADARRPGSGTSDYEDVDAVEVAAFLTVFTFYAPDLENRMTGQGGFIEPTMAGNASRLQRSVESAILRVTS